VKKSSLDAYYLFIAPPSMEELEKRLRGRGTEKEESIIKRLSAAQGEMDYGSKEGNFDVVLTNNNLEKTKEEMIAKFIKWYPDLLGEDSNINNQNGVAKDEDEDIPPPIVDPLSFPKNDEGLKALLSEIDKDCPLDGYTSNELHYQASNIYIAAGKTLDIPLPPIEKDGSKINWTVTVQDDYNEKLDVDFGLVVIVDGEDVVAREMGRILSPSADDSTEGNDGEKVSAKGKFTVANSAPVRVVIKLDNSYSWLKGKKVSYSFTITSPVDDNMIQRSLRAKSVLPNILEGQKELTSKKENELSRAEALGRMQDEMKEKLEGLTPERIKQSIEAIKKRADEAEEEAKVKANEIKDALSVVKKEEQAIDECTTSIKALEEECARLKAKWEKLKVERKAHEEEKVKKEKEAEEYKEMRIKLQEEIQQKKEDEQTKLKELDSIESERTLLQGNLDDLEKEKKARKEDEQKYAAELKFLSKQEADVKLRFIDVKK